MLTSDTRTNDATRRDRPQNGSHPSAPKPYVAKKFDFSGIEGLSQHALEIHRSLYEGYVKETNALLPLLSANSGEDAAPGSAGATLERLKLDGLVRRFRFERNGMVLHELFFETLCSNRGGKSEAANKSTAGSVFTELAENTFGSFEAWQNNIRKLAQTRGVGWVLTVLSDQGDRLHNIWVDEHQDGLLSEGRILLAIDLWEHAFMLDYKPTERLQYLQVIFDNIDWEVVEKRCE